MSSFFAEEVPSATFEFIIRRIMIPSMYVCGFEVFNEVYRLNWRSLHYCLSMAYGTVITVFTMVFLERDIRMKTLPLVFVIPQVLNTGLDIITTT